jgi:DNA-binding PadR family transcriptional regulator
VAFRVDLESLILAVLGDQPIHGYEIARRIKLRSGEALSVGEGLLYPTLHKLNRDGLVTAEWVTEEGRPARKEYRLTEAGTRMLAAKQKEWQRFASGVSSVMGATHG